MLNTTNKSDLKIPLHLAVIMDGNGRWAKKHHLPKSAGHKKGANAAKSLVKHCQSLGIKYLTLYTFSSENWQRPKDEVNYLMDLLRTYLRNDLQELLKENVRLRFIGNKQSLPIDIHQDIMRIEHESKDNDFNLIMALSYGSRDEIRTAAFSFAKDIIEKKIDINSLPSTEFDKYLSTADIPDPDLYIRTSGEYRVSNFLLWQIAYSELYFTDVLWPDFNEQDLLNALKDYSKRERRYGGRNSE